MITIESCCRSFSSKKMQIFHYCLCSTAAGLCIAPDNYNHWCFFYCSSTFRCNTTYYHIVQWHFSWNFKCFLCLGLHSHIKMLSLPYMSTDITHFSFFFFLVKLTNWISAPKFQLTLWPIYQFSFHQLTIHTLQPSPALSLQLKF